MKNIFTFPGSLDPNSTQEFFETLLRGQGLFFLERIISHGHITPEGTWLNQYLDEWVVVLEGEAVLAYEDGAEVYLARGDSLFLPKHKKHRVIYSSSPCIWLAVHGEALKFE